MFVTLAVPLSCVAQGSFTVNFDGPPNQPSGSQVLVQQYFESGMSFEPLPGSDGFGRVWTGMPPEWPSDGTPYVQTGTGDSLAFSFQNGASFGLSSVDLAAFTTGIPDYTVNFTGYRADGSTITTSFSGNGINFQTYNFASAWSSGLTKVEIPNSDWSLDNLVVIVPEPSTGALFLIGGFTFSVWRGRRRKSL
jgi:hypothetical protein